MLFFGVLVFSMDLDALSQLKLSVDTSDGPTVQELLSETGLDEG
jgi:hypothetical protein